MLQQNMVGEGCDETALEEWSGGKAPIETDIPIQVYSIMGNMLLSLSIVVRLSLPR